MILLSQEPCSEIMTVLMLFFGLDISLDQEAILDTWVLWGSKFKWGYLLSYAFKMKKKWLFPLNMKIVDLKKTY